jgi:hypothetical protein
MKICTPLDKKILLLVIIIVILIFISIDKAFTFDYANATRDQLLQRCLYFAKQLKQEQAAHLDTQDELKDAYQNLNNLQNRITQLQSNLQNIIAIGQACEMALNKRIDSPYQPGELMFSFSIGVGTSINMGVESRIYIWKGLYGYLSVDGFYGQYWDFQSYPYALALGGLGWSF